MGPVFRTPGTQRCRALQGTAGRRSLELGAIHAAAVANSTRRHGRNPRDSCARRRRCVRLPLEGLKRKGPRPHQAPANGYSEPQGRFRLTYRVDRSARRVLRVAAVRTTGAVAADDRSDLSGRICEVRDGQVRGVQDGTGQRGRGAGVPARCRTVAKHL